MVHAERLRSLFPGMTVEAPPDDGAVRAAVLVPILDLPDDPTLLYTLRPLHMPTHAGDVAFPGGRPEPGESPVETALREAWEEVGLPPDRVEVVGFLPEIHTVAYRRMVVPVVGVVEGRPELRPDPDEVARIIEARVADLRDPGRWRSETWDGHRVWFYDLDGAPLWGATAAMTRRLLGLEV